MDLVINGEERTFEKVKTLDDLLCEIGISRDGSGIAVALNDAVVPRRAWAECAIRHGDRVEVIHAVQGG